jgi:hypothetical protein
MYAKDSFVCFFVKGFHFGEVTLLAAPVAELVVVSVSVKVFIFCVVFFFLFIRL